MKSSQVSRGEIEIELIVNAFILTPLQVNAMHITQYINMIISCLIYIHIFIQTLNFLPPYAI